MTSGEISYSCDRSQKTKAVTGYRTPKGGSFSEDDGVQQQKTGES
jgi:hypothetical protein